MSNDTRPEIRFPGFTEDWEERKLIDLVVRLNKNTNSSRLPKVEFEDIVAGEGRLNKDVSQKFDNRKGIEFLPNDILYGKLRPYLKNWLKASFTGVAIGDFWVFRAKKSDSDFIYSLIQADRYQKAANDTSGTKMPRSDWKKVSDTVFYIPNDLKEQQKIGIFFKKLDDTITLHQRKLDLLKETKKGFLQKMFPKNGAKVPEIRFPGFTGDWEERKLTELATTYIGLVTTMTKNYTESGTLLIRNSDIKEGKFDLNNPIYLKEDFAEQNKTRRMRNGDVVTVHTGDIGTSAVITEDLEGTIGFATITTRPSKELDSNFLSWYFNSNIHKKYARRMSTGDGRSNYNMKDFNKNVIAMPAISEQQKIGTFFKQLNDTITLHQRELDVLKETKKGFLQKMFV